MSSRNKGRDYQGPTVRELIEELKGHDPDATVIFGDAALNFYRFKKRGDKLVQLEFNEIVYKDGKTIIVDP